jgi:iron complex outermembrane receptor protein
MVRYVGALPNQGVADYWASDVRVAWKPTDKLELAVVGKNLFDPQHPEFGTDSALHEIQRGVFGTVTYRW